MYVLPEGTPVLATFKTAITEYTESQVKMIINNGGIQLVVGLLRASKSDREAWYQHVIVDTEPVERIVWLTITNHGNTCHHIAFSMVHIAEGLWAHIYDPSVE